MIKTSSEHGLPTSIRPFPPTEQQWRYHPPEALDPMAACGGWDPQDHYLSFRTETITAEQFGLVVRSPVGRTHRSFDEPMRDLRQSSEDLQRNLAQKLNALGYVADQAGLEISVEYTVAVRVKAWPAVAGVTTEESA